jgi:hypothetical protein
VQNECRPEEEFDPTNKGKDEAGDDDEGNQSSC